MGRLYRASFARGAVVADYSRELGLEHFAFCQCHRRSRSEGEVVAIVVILEAYFKAYLSCAFL